MQPEAIKPAVQATGPVREWTGREAVALRKALRMTEAKFARAVDVSPRTVANWHTKPETVPRNAAQDMLDELLNGASPAVVERFERIAGHQAAPDAPPGDVVLFCQAFLADPHNSGPARGRDELTARRAARRQR